MADSADSKYGTIVKLVALTGCRREEIGGLQWNEIDFDKKVSSIPGSRTKKRQAARGAAVGLAIPSIRPQVTVHSDDAAFHLVRAGVNVKF